MKRSFIIIVVVLLALAGGIIIKMALAKLMISSPAFEHGALMPGKYTCDGENINPPLEISGIPAGAKSLVLIMDDPDAPSGIWDHWLKWNIPVASGTTVIVKEGEAPLGVSGRGTGGQTNYQGPCPPSGTHRYFFKVYALDTELALPEGGSKAELEAAMAGHVLAQGELVGRYSR